eukprot:CAMPEP_0204597200 /NCGR_PEP_ID=MMETSP0661-20131031/53671_1 /ASSEMBLY_ACC=CAM_ASM_000606 /TAXON_ID=109239 /ORGANISM="Alexandrium margalefi, Strain AMGDE01CS-322" /LENGTH=236 /DNA_ID=CAMNT_0051607881 /DNA_START=296 /DNA_END=1006 /DNA_ORIENTATION=-
MGYAVDIVSVTYRTPFDKVIRDTLGQNLRKLELIERTADTNQVTNVVANLQIFDAYVKNMSYTYDMYRFVIVARHDERFAETFVPTLLKFPSDKVFLSYKQDKTLCPVWPNPLCTERTVWYNPDRASITWMADDRIQILPGSKFEAYRRLIYGPTQLEPVKQGPMWPGNCWAELAPLVGGMQELEFLGTLHKSVFTICRPPHTCRTGSFTRIDKLRGGHVSEIAVWDAMCDGATDG